MLENRFKDLYNRSLNKGIYTYTGFMYEADAAPALKEADRREVTVWGGYPEAERVMVRFGNEEEIAWQEPFPIVVLEVRPANEKFSDELGHRDYLGALMNLGIERDVIGDILVKENAAWIMVIENMADYICDELRQVKHTTVRAERADAVPENVRPAKEAVLLNVASSRADSVVARFCNLSRSKVPELFAAGKVLINNAECSSPGRLLKEGEAITVRGFGKFFYLGIEKETKKKREVVRIEKYVK